MQECDAAALFRICSDRDWLKRWGSTVHETKEDSRRTIERLLESYREGRELRWGICLRSDGSMIGAAGFLRFVPEHFRGEISYEQAKGWCGKGYMTEALRAIVRFGFEHVGLHTIEAGIDPEHAASINVAERLGMKREGFLRENYFFEGRFYDTLLYSLIGGVSAA